MAFAGCVSVRRRTLTALLCSFCFRGRGGQSPLKQKEKDERGRVAHADTDGSADRAAECRVNSAIRAAAIGSCCAKQNMTLISQTGSEQSELSCFCPTGDVESVLLQDKFGFL